MAKFWSEYRNLSVGDERLVVKFIDNSFSTDDNEIVDMLRKKAKIKALGIVEITPQVPVEPEKSTELDDEPENDSTLGKLAALKTQAKKRK